MAPDQQANIHFSVGRKTDDHESSTKSAVTWPEYVTDRMSCIIL
jgi:hypothetical protein